MDFLIGNINPPSGANYGSGTPNEANFGRELDENKGNQGGGPQTTPPVEPQTGGEDKKTNWYLYAILGIVALSLILGNKK